MLLPRLQCVICFSTASFKHLSALCCGHTFHFPCITEWMKNRMQCPVCRKKITAKDIIKFLSFQIVKSDPLFGDGYDPTLSDMFQMALNFPLHSKELFCNYFSQRMELTSFIQRLDESESEIIEEEIQCYACFKCLNLTDIAALRCGHTFHPLCISRRVKIEQKCPFCWKKARKDSIIPHLYFEIEEKDEDSSDDDEAKTLAVINKAKAELELIHIHAKHNSLLLNIIKEVMINRLNRINMKLNKECLED